MLGIDFENCNNFSFEVSFESCLLNHSTFFQVNLKNTKFTKTKLQEVDFTEADLSGSSFNNCDLQRAVFGRTNLGKVDFRTAENFTIDPEENRVKGALFSRHNLDGLLMKYQIKIS